MSHRLEYDELASDFCDRFSPVIEVRIAKPGDGVLLLATTRELGASHGWGPTMTAEASDFERDLFCANPIIGALLAFSDGRFAGSALWHRSYATSRGQEVMYLEDIVVLPEFRRLGVAEVLLKEVARTAINKGYKKVFWLMMQWNSGARKLYEKVGAEIEDGNCYCSVQDQALADLAK